MGLQFRKLYADLRLLTSYSYRVQYFHLTFFAWDDLPIKLGSSLWYPPPPSIHYMYGTFYLITPLNLTLPVYLPSSARETLLSKLIFYYRLNLRSQVAVLLLRNSILHFTVYGQFKNIHFTASCQNIGGTLLRIFLSNSSQFWYVIQATKANKKLYTILSRKVQNKKGHITILFSYNSFTKSQWK